MNKLNSITFCGILSNLNSCKIDEIKTKFQIRLYLLTHSLTEGNF